MVVQYISTKPRYVTSNVTRKRFGLFSTHRFQCRLYLNISARFVFENEFAIAKGQTDNPDIAFLVADLVLEQPISAEQWRCELRNSNPSQSIWAQSRFGFNWRAA